MVADADDVETRLVGQAGMLEHLADLVDAGLQPKAEEDLTVGVHHAYNVRDVRRTCQVEFGPQMSSRTAHHR